LQIAIGLVIGGHYANSPNITVGKAPNIASITPA
jgi:hypothetical protein